MFETSISKLIRLCHSIANDGDLLKELQEDIIVSNRESALISIIKAQLKSTSVDNLGFADELLPLFFEPNTITGIELHSSANIGIKCFFMSEGTFFPIHDHPNQVVITNVLYGNVKYMSLDKTSEPNILLRSEKKNGKAGNVMFNTLNFRNCHTILAQRNTVILDIFMQNVSEDGVYYKVLRNTGRKFFVEIDENVHFLTRSFKAQDCDCKNEEKNNSENFL